MDRRHAMLRRQVRKKFDLNRWAEGLDPYIDMAALIHGIDYDDVRPDQRADGKVVSLAGAYGQAPDGLRAQARQWGIMLSHEEADHYSAAFHAANLNIFALHRRLEAAFRKAVGATEGAWKPCEKLVVKASGPDVGIKLPSGRWLAYRNLRWGRGGNLFYGAGRGRKLRGGHHIFQNAAQAVARDLLAAGLLRARAAGLDVVMHIHDSIFIETAEPDVDGPALVEAMTAPLPWSEGLPLAAEAEIKPWTAS